MWRNLKKYGLGHCDLPTMVENVASLMRLHTLNIDARNDAKIPALCYVMTIVGILSFLYIYVGCGVWSAIWHCYRRGDLASCMVLFSLAITSSIGIVKLAFMLVYEDMLRQVVKKYLDCDSQVVPGSRFAKNLRRALKNVKTRAILYWATIMSNGFSYLIIYIIIPGRHSQSDGLVIFGLEPLEESPNFEIAMTFMGFDVMFICYLVGNITGFIIIIIGYTEAQILALSQELVHVWEDARRMQQNETNNDEEDVKEDIHPDGDVNNHVRNLLVDIAKKHALNVNLFGQISLAMRGPIFMGFLFLIIGLIAELLGGLENTYLQLPFSMIQVAIDCFIGQRVMDASVVFEEAVYLCNWERFDVANRRIVLIILLNAQKRMSLSAGGMATLSFSCFMTIVNRTYSAYATLRSSTM